MDPEVQDLIKAAQKIGQKVRRFGFVSTEFMDVEDYEAPSRIVTVENVVTAPGA
jgi:hypothetical protein